VYPALAIAEALNPDETEIAFIGSVDGFERPLIEESGVNLYSYDEVRAGPLHGVSWGKRAHSLLDLSIGTVQALRLLRRHRPAALLLTGGWVGLPVALAAWLLRVPSLIFLPDIEPGLSIRVLQRFARRVATTVDESSQFFPHGKTVTTGYPLRRQMREATRAEAITHFGLDPARQTLLVFGGSRGARSLNLALLEIVPALLADGLQIIHVSGTLDWEQVEARRGALPDASHYHAFPYLHQAMGLAMACADLVVSRAGASTLGEFPFFGLPAVLVPYPHAWRYQKVNADYLAARGAAICMHDADMGRDLLPEIRNLFADPARLSQMRAAAQQMAQPDGAARVAQELVRLTQE
jgi:UDP-N-acetylglucosamine--N-acetylmuramyl-(pentapeptide) pyrophosphoryl-undecaprenol N-acetylglucosamine transferase